MQFRDSNILRIRDEHPIQAKTMEFVEIFQIRIAQTLEPPAFSIRRELPYFKQWTMGGIALVGWGFKYPGEHIRKQLFPLLIVHF